jgi:hypothetical protein
VDPSARETTDDTCTLRCQRYFYGNQIPRRVLRNLSVVLLQECGTMKRQSRWDIATDKLSRDFVWDIIKIWARSRVVVKALRYKPEGRGFETRWCEFIFVSIYLILPVALGPGVHSTSNINEYQKQKKLFLCRCLWADCPGNVDP